MSDEWDAENFEVKVPVEGLTDRWKDEDLDDVKDNWDDEEEAAQETGDQQPAVAKKKKKKLEDILLEKELKKKEEAEKRKLAKKEAEANMTAEELADEKLRQQKLQEEADLELAKEAFGVDVTVDLHKLDLETKEDFDEFRKGLVDKLKGSERSPFYAGFLEDLLKDLTLEVDFDDVKKLSSAINLIHSEKLRLQKGTKSKKKKQGTKLHVGKAEDIVANYDDFDDMYDDFI